MKVLASVVAVLSISAASAVDASPDAGLGRVLASREFGTFMTDRNAGPLVAAKTDGRDFLDFYDDGDCGGELVTFMTCLPDCASGCIFQSFLGTDWGNCTEIETHLETSTQCVVNHAEGTCENETAALVACAEKKEAEAPGPCTESPETAPTTAAALVAAELDHGDGECEGEMATYMTCLPACESGCIFKSALGTDWTDCTSIMTHFNTSSACLHGGDGGCGDQLTAMRTCFEQKEADAPHPCDESPETDPATAAVPVAANLRGAVE